MISAQIRANSDTIGYVEVQRIDSNPGGIHLYHAKWFEGGRTVKSQYVNHKESDGVLVLLKRALEGLT